MTNMFNFAQIFKNSSTNHPSHFKPTIFLQLKLSGCEKGFHSILKKIDDPNFGLNDEMLLDVNGL